MKPKVYPTAWIRQLSRLLRFCSSLCSLFYKDIFSRLKLNGVSNPSFILKNTKLDSGSQATALKASTLAKSNETPSPCADSKAQSNVPESSVVFHLCHFATAQGLFRSGCQHRFEPHQNHSLTLTVSSVKFLCPEMFLVFSISLAQMGL